MKPPPVMVTVDPVAPATSVVGETVAIAGTGFVGGGVEDPPPPHALKNTAATKESKLWHKYFRSLIECACRTMGWASWLVDVKKNSGRSIYQKSLIN